MKRFVQVLFAVPWWFFFVVDMALLVAFILLPDFRQAQVMRRGIDPALFVIFLTAQLMALLRVYVKR